MTRPYRKRCKRYDIDGDAHCLTFSCFRRLALLSRERSCRWLLDALQLGLKQGQFDLWAYVIMPEHVHENPLRRGLVHYPEAWPWSSCRAWQTGDDEPVPIDRDSLPGLMLSDSSTRHR